MKLSSSLVMSIITNDKKKTLLWKSERRYKQSTARAQPQFEFEPFKIFFFQI